MSLDGDYKKVWEEIDDKIEKSDSSLSFFDLGSKAIMWLGEKIKLAFKQGNIALANRLKQDREVLENQDLRPTDDE